MPTRSDEEAIERTAWKIGLTALGTLASFRLVESPGRVFLNERRHRRFAFGFVCCAILIVVPVGFHIRGANYVNNLEWEVARGGRVINAAGKSQSVMLMGDSLGSMYGEMMKNLAEEEDLRLTVISVAGGDPLPKQSGEPGALWQSSLAAVQKERPAVLFLACRWEGSLEESRARLPLALGLLRPFVGRIVLLTEPPSLPEEATRARIRSGSRPPFFEDNGRRQARQEMSRFVKSLEDDKVKVLEVEPYFVSNRTGEVLFEDSRGQQLYQDREHISSAGAARIKASVSAACRS